MECPLCNAKNQDYRLIYEDEYSFCVVIKWPLKPGHVMILPKRHVENKKDLNEKEAKSLFEMIQKLQETIKKAYNQDAIVHMNSGSLGSQKHLHIHVLPSKGNLREMVAEYENIPEREEMPRQEMEKVKEYIQKFI